MSYYDKLNLVCEHVFAGCLSDTNQFVRQMASDYFLVLAQQMRILHVYHTLDRSSDFRLVPYVLHHLEV